MNGLQLLTEDQWRGGRSWEDDSRLLSWESGRTRYGLGREVHRKPYISWILKPRFSSRPLKQVPIGPLNFVSIL